MIHNFAALLGMVSHLLVASSDQTCPSMCRCATVANRFITDCTNSDPSSPGYNRLPPGISPKTMHLILDNNQLTGVDWTRTAVFSLVGLHNLMELSLRNTSIQEIQGEAFAGLSNLRELKLDWNSITNVEPNSFKHLSSLTHLDLSRNSIHSISNRAFHGCSNLIHLNLAYNQIDQQNLLTTTFRPAINLHTIQLDHNRMARIFPDPFSHLSELHTLSLLHNPFICDCHLRDFVAWERGRYITDPPLCVEPSRTRGKPWSELQLQEFACTPRVDPKTTTPTTRKAGETFMIDCSADGDPLPKVKWEFRRDGGSPQDANSVDNVRINNGPLAGAVKAVVSQLKVSNASAANTGQYHCIASNIGGSDYIVYSVTISEAGASLSSEDLRSATQQKEWLVVILIIGSAALLVLCLVLSVICIRRRQSRSSIKVPVNNGCYKHYEIVSTDSACMVGGSLRLPPPPPPKPHRTFTDESAGNWHAPDSIAALQRCSVRIDETTYSHQTTYNNASSYSALPVTSTPLQCPLTVDADHAGKIDPGALSQDDSGYLDTDVPSQRSSQTRPSPPQHQTAPLARIEDTETGPCTIIPLKETAL